MKECTDFLGNKFSSLKEMSLYWGLTPNCVSSRLHKKWSLKDALMKPMIGCICRIPDPETGELLNQKEYAQRVGINPATFRARKRQGFAKELIYEPIKLNCIPAQDHTGRRFESINEMCAFWGVKPNVFYGRFTTFGWSLEEALTRPTRTFTKRKKNS